MVKSLPKATVAVDSTMPYLAPRCRRMMFPGSTDSPPNFFTPSILGWLSRPFLVLPPALLVAQRTAPTAEVAAEEAVVAEVGAAAEATSARRDAAAAKTRGRRAASIFDAAFVVWVAGARARGAATWAKRRTACACACAKSLGARL